MAVKKKTEYQRISEEEKRIVEEKKRVEKLKQQLILDYEKKVETTGEAKLDVKKDKKECGSVVLKPHKTSGNETRKAVNGVHCLGKKMGGN